jgi:hypothetical protein
VTAAAYSFTDDRTERPHPVSVRPAPRREPPFDDELAPRHLHAVGPWDRALPFTAQSEQAAHQPAFGDAPLPAHLPEPAPWGQRLLIGVIEVAGGRRPLQQLSALMSYPVARGLGTDFERAAAAGHRHWTHAATVRSVRASQPAAGVAELCATVVHGRRVRAVAMRLEDRAGRWQCTRLQLG